MNIKQEALDRRAFIQGVAATGVAAAGMAILGNQQANADEAPSEDALTDGTYTATAPGFAGDVTVTIEVSAGSMASVSAEAPSDTPDRGGKAATVLADAIQQAGGTGGVDTYSGATVTSNGIIQAAEDCLAQAAGQTTDIPPVAMKAGIYVGEGMGFNWFEPVRVKIEVDESSLLSVEVIEKGLNREEPLILKSVEDRMLPRMIEAQSVKVDSITGATSSSAGVKAATEDALKKALAAGGSNQDAIKNFYVSPTYDEGTEETLDYDIVVCGFGGAGCAAGMAAVEAQVAAGQPVSVLAIETAGKYGGTAANAGEPFAVNAPRFLEEFNNSEKWCDYDSLYEDWIAKYSIGTPCKPEVVKLLMDESGNSLDWLQFDHGFVFTRGMKGFGTSTWLCKQQYVYSTNREGDIDYATLYPDYNFDQDRSSCVGMYYDHIVSDYEAAGGKYLLETTVDELVFDNGKVVGVSATDNVTHKKITVNAKAVIMCTGGFGGNQDLMVEYLQNPEYPMAQRWNLWGMRQNKGQVVKSAIDQGIATYNLDMPPIIHFKTTAQILTKYPTYYRDGKDTRMLEQNCWSSNDLPLDIGTNSQTLQVGTDGLRHYNEAGTFAFWAGGATWYTIVGKSYLDRLAEGGFPGDPGTYQGSIASVYNQGGYPNAQPIPQIYEVLDAAVEKGYVYKGDTIEALAEAAGLPVDDFAAQVERYKEFCASGEDTEWGRAAESLADDKIGEEGPFYAIECNPVPYATHAAIDVDTNISALWPDGSEVEGLYACGNDSGGVLETNLLPYAQYGGVALGWAFTSGRLAGTNAVAYAATL